MILHDGDTVFLAFATFNRWEGSQAWVTECVVIDGANGVVRERGTFGSPDRVRVLESSSSETLHPTAAGAWRQVAATFDVGAVKLAAKAAECSRRAAELAVETEVAV
jgi:hypothetical protein